MEMAKQLERHSDTALPHVAASARAWCRMLEEIVPPEAGSNPGLEGLKPLSAAR